MHYLQNGWFVTNWIWVISFLVLAVAVVAYINNKGALLKKSLVALSITFVVAVIGSLMFTHSSSILPSSNLQLNAPNTETAQVESGSVFNKLTAYIIGIVSDKVSE
jgi:Mn2+/Fe2+ NRAMP family transporter